MCPLPKQTTADGLEVGFPAALSIEAVSAARGSLAAKLSAKNQPQQDGVVRVCRWRALYGFYTTRNAFRQQVRPVWNRTLKHGWQEALREGMKLGTKYSQGVVYVSKNAISTPPCPILQGMQQFRAKEPVYNYFERGARPAKNTTKPRETEEAGEATRTAEQRREEERKEMLHLFWDAAVSRIPLSEVGQLYNSLVHGKNVS